VVGASQTIGHANLNAQQMIGLFPSPEVITGVAVQLQDATAPAQPLERAMARCDWRSSARAASEAQTTCCRWFHSATMNFALVLRGQSIRCRPGELSQIDKAYAVFVA